MSWILIIAAGLVFYFFFVPEKNKPQNKWSDKRESELIYLRFAIKMMAEEGTIDKGEAADILEKIDFALDYLSFEEQEGSRNFSRLNDAWYILGEIEGGERRKPPWLRQTELPYSEPDMDALQTFSEQLSVAEKEQTIPVEEKPAHTPDETEGIEIPQQEDGFQHAWEPAKPKALEAALERYSKWPKTFLPFLVQNVGWFIGTFCFVTGSIFLVAYTEGITKALVIFISLCSYTMFLIWGGYQLRVKRKDLETASGVLLTTAMLLVPLNFSVIARMLVESSDSVWLTILSLIIAAFALALFYYASQLISGVTDRALQGEHPRIFLMLASTQLCVPLVTYWPTWPLLAISHSVLLAVAAYGLVRYSQSWMYSIFVEKRKIAYYAAGTLLYAALISFVHITWGAAELSVPNGYYGPYIMAITGLLFYLDFQFKEWADGHLFLSRFTFFVYGLSVLALLMALEDPVTRMLTFILATVIYSIVTWKYLTLVPLYLLMFSVSGLYYQAILQFILWPLYFLASLPALAAVIWLCRRVLSMENARTGTQRVMLMEYRFVLALATLLVSWSLFFSQPGILALISSLSYAALIWWILGDVPGHLISGNNNRINLRTTSWQYLVLLALTVSVFFAPSFTDFQGALILTLLACCWCYVALKAYKVQGEKTVEKTEVYINSTLMGIMVAIFSILAHKEPAIFSDFGIIALIFVVAAGIMLVLSLSLYSQELFYITLFLLVCSCVFLKLFLAPELPVTPLLLISGFCAWIFLWWQTRQPDELVQLRIERAKSAPRLTLLWIFPLTVANDAKSSADFSGKEQGDDHV